MSSSLISSYIFDRSLFASQFTDLDFCRVLYDRAWRERGSRIGRDRSVDSENELVRVDETTLRCLFRVACGHAREPRTSRGRRTRVDVFCEKKTRIA